MGLVDSFKKMWNPPEDEYEDDYVDVYANSDASAPAASEAPAREEPRETVRRSNPSSGSNKVVNIHATAQLQVVLFKPEHFGEEVHRSDGGRVGSARVRGGRGDFDHLHFDPDLSGVRPAETQSDPLHPDRGSRDERRFSRDDDGQPGRHLHRDERGIDVR